MDERERTEFVDNESYAGNMRFDFLSVVRYNVEPPKVKNTCVIKLTFSIFLSLIFLAALRIVSRLLGVATNQFI